MLDGRLLNKLTGVHGTHHASDHDNNIITPQQPSHATATDTTRAQAARPRTNTTRGSSAKATSQKMAGTSAYDRLEGGLGPQRGPVGRRNWKKYAIIASLVLGVLWFAAPRSETYPWNKNKGTLIVVS